MDQAELIEMLRKRVADSGGAQSGVARELGISRQYLNNILAARIDPGPKVLEALGLVRHVTYLPVQESL